LPIVSLPCFVVWNDFTFALSFMSTPDKFTDPLAIVNLGQSQYQTFYNLIDVYLDAVFYPRIAPQTLEQEGWHFELSAPDQPLTIKGVVYNEMKGVYSSPDAALARYARRSLFPNNTYAHDSGGDPARIPELTYRQFKHFYDSYYDPSNARLWFYGDDPADLQAADANQSSSIVNEEKRAELDGVANHQIVAAFRPHDDYWQILPAARSYRPRSLEALAGPGGHAAAPPRSLGGAAPPSAATICPDLAGILRTEFWPLLLA